MSSTDPAASSTDPAVTSDHSQSRAERNDAAVRRFLAKLHDETHPDLDDALSGFAPDATYQSLVPARSIIEGRPAIKAELERQFGRYSNCVCEILAAASSDRHVFTERRDHVTMAEPARRIFSSVNAVFDFDDDGRIVAWREYWDTGDIAAQLGLRADQMAALHGLTS